MSDRPWNPNVPLPWRAGLAYGLLGLPLAFAALPLYVVLPHHYASDLGLPLAGVGALLLLVRLIDAGAEPLLGRLSDALYRLGVPTVLGLMALLCALLGLGMAALFFPQAQGGARLAAWLVAGLLATSLAHSLLVLTHQAWGVRLGGDALQRGRIVSWREGAGLAGVVGASALAVAWGAGAMLAVFVPALLAGCWALARAPRPPRAAPLAAADAGGSSSRLWQPLTEPAFRRLLGVYACNGIASAVPAALMLFFAQDRLGATAGQTAGFLVLYFVCGALSLPLWLRHVRRVGLARTWRAGMLLAVAGFGWAAALGRGQVAPFALICTLSGAALGADLAVPGALLALLIARQGAEGMRDGAYLGWWNLATKLNLALAAGAALPLLQWLGYAPGSQDAQALRHLAWIYALLPCALKLLAAALLQRWLTGSIPDPQGVTS